MELRHLRYFVALVEAAVEAARRAAQPAKKTFAIGFQTGHEMNWLPRAMHVLRDELKNLDIKVSSDYSPDLAEALLRGRLDVAFLRVETEDYLRRSGLDIKLNHGVDSASMAVSLVASMRGLALMPAYAKNLLPWSVVSRPLEGEPPTIDLAVGYSKANTSPILKLFLSRLEELRAPMPEKKN